MPMVVMAKAQIDTNRVWPMSQVEVVEVVRVSGFSEGLFGFAQRQRERRKRHVTSGMP